MKIEIPEQHLPGGYRERINAIKGHLSLSEWILVLIQEELHNPKAKVFA